MYLTKFRGLIHRRSPRILISPSKCFVLATKSEVPRHVSTLRAPDTLRDLYNQRLRWYRGNYMTIFKHRGILSEPTTGFLYRFAFPLRLIELLFLPFASWVILGLIVKILLSGFVIQVVSLFVFFLSIIFLIAALGVYIEGEDWRLLWYTPPVFSRLQAFPRRVAAQESCRRIVGPKLVVDASHTY